MADAKRSRPGKANEPTPPGGGDPGTPPGPPGGSGAKQSKVGRGGKRAGAGAPRRNQNARKHGIWSKLVGDALVEEALALGELPPEERARMHRLIREARVLRAARQKDTSLQALDRGWASILADLDPDAGEVGGESEVQGIVVLDADSEDWLDG